MLEEGRLQSLFCKVLFLTPQTCTCLYFYHNPALQSYPPLQILNWWLQIIQLDLSSYRRMIRSLRHNYCGLCAEKDLPLHLHDDKQLEELPTAAVRAFSNKWPFLTFWWLFWWLLLIHTKFSSTLNRYFKQNSWRPCLLMLSGIVPILLVRLTKRMRRLGIIALISVQKLTLQQEGATSGSAVNLHPPVQVHAPFTPGFNCNY